MTKTVTVLTVLIALGSIPFAFAASHNDDKLEFAGTLEETLGHFWALEQNLDEGNAELALIHATHPIAELYDTMSMHLEANPEFDMKLQETLLDLQNRANTEVSREDAQAAIDEAKEIISEARMIVVGEDLSNDSKFKIQLINQLLETAKVEYQEAVTDGIIGEMAEFQDGSAFVWRSQQILDTLSDLENHEVDDIESKYDNLWTIFDSRADPSEMKSITDEIISEFVEISGVESKESEHMMEAFGQLPPLQQVKEGIAPENVECKEGLELIFKATNGNPACVSSSSATKLIAMGWASA
jgi:hypothetical protein